jgi:fructoselysine-6-P-deglycase FrlB-like protein
MNEIMLQEMNDQGPILAASVPAIRTQAQALRGSQPERVVLTGCGDSWHAVASVEHLFGVTLQRSVLALPSLTASRFGQFSAGTILVSVSISGEVARTIEVAKVAHKSRATVVAITSNADSTLARSSDVAITMPAPISRATPHTRDYTLTLLALAATLEEIAAVRFGELDVWPQRLASTVNSSLEWARHIPTGRGARVWFLGAGPDRGTAGYGALKFWEAGMAAWCDELEEFGHGSQLMAEPGDDVMIFACGPARSRAEEMLPGFLHMGMRPLIVTDDPTTWPTQSSGPSQFAFAPLGSAPWSPFLSCIPAQALTLAYAQRRGIDVTKPLDGRDFATQYHETHVEWARNSRIET